MSGRKLTLRQKYPNVLPRLMVPEVLTREGKVILVVGRLHRGTCYGDLREIVTIDGRGKHELHVVRVEHLQSNLIQASK